VGNLARSATVVGALVLGCGGGGSQQRVNASARQGPADVTARRALLARISPRGEAIIAAYEALPTTFELPEGPWTESSEDTFDGYFRDSAIDTVVTYMTTGVHEMTHGYNGRMGFQLLAERDLSYGDGAMAFPIGEAPQLVRFTPTFPSIELASTFPGDVHTFRYEGYIDPAQPTLGTQRYGVYGLLDEYVAGYTGMRTTVDFWPWVRDEAPVDAQLIINYAVMIDDILGEYAEFRLFILHYMLHARDNHPDVYEAVLANDDFRAAFVAVDDAFGQLAADARALEPEVWALAVSRGVRIDKVDGVLRIDGYPQREADAVRRVAVFAYLEQDAYRAISDALR
jgi:hypothetical protein